MELGQKLRSARLDAGLSQRQLCGDEITRNMLSQIENGSARPSMDTLRYLAGRLGKPISFFLEEEAVTSPNQPLMEQARQAFAAKEYTAAIKLLEQYRHPDPVFAWERSLLVALCCLALAEDAISRDHLPYAIELLDRAAESGGQTPYYSAELERQRLLLLAQLGETTLPADDRELLLRTEMALSQNNPHRAGQYLDATEDQSSRKWNFLRGQVYLSQEQYADAVSCFEAALDAYPKACCAYLEQCCRELDDYKGAYFYACKLRELEG